MFNFKMFVFPYFSLTMGIHFSHILGILWISASPKIFKKPITLECFFFPVLCGFTFPMFWELHGFLLQVKNFKKPLTVKCLCFSIFFLYYGISLFPYFGNCMDFCFIQNIWEIHYRGMFFFFFMYYRNSLLPYFENCMDFCFAWNI